MQRYSMMQADLPDESEGAGAEVLPSQQRSSQRLYGRSNVYMAKRGWLYLGWQPGNGDKGVR